MNRTNMSSVDCVIQVEPNQTWSPDHQRGPPRGCWELHMFSNQWGWDCLSDCVSYFCRQVKISLPMLRVPMWSHAVPGIYLFTIFVFTQVNVFFICVASILQQHLFWIHLWVIYQLSTRDVATCCSVSHSSIFLFLFCERWQLNAWSFSRGLSVSSWQKPQPW